MAFVPLMHVFPGGRVEARDYDVKVTFVGSDDERSRLARRASTDEAELGALYACAVRETTEETGVVLVATTADGGMVIDPAVMPIVDHWVTPDVENHRYDTRFFAAVLPEGQESRLMTTEADHAEWIPAATAVERFNAGEMSMVPPTIGMLQYLTTFADCESMLANSAARAVVPLLPVRTIHEDGRVEWSLTHDTRGRP